MSDFSTLNTALRGMQAQQQAMATTSHNIANTNTPGFSRQQAILAATPGIPAPGANHAQGVGQMGTGVEVSEVRRIRDQFLDRQIRLELGKLGEWETKRDALEQVEVLFMEPSETGLNSLMGQFWDSWQELSKSADSSPVRTTVRETAQALTDAFRHTYAQMDLLKTHLQDLQNDKLAEINSLGRQIADLNQQIVTIKGSDPHRMNPNDLLDRRDQLLDQLAELTDYTLINQDYGSIDIQVTDDSGADHMLVQGKTYTPVAGLTATTGEWHGIESAIQTVEEYQEHLDTLARGLRDRVNEIHQAGYDLDGESNIAFFQGNGAADIEVSDEVMQDVRNIAAASDTDTEGNPIPVGAGNGINALKIAQLRRVSMEVSGSGATATLVEAASGGTTIDNFYKDFITTLGIHSHEADRMRVNQEALVEQLTNRRDSISGVSLDEELAHLVQYQRAYQASAKVIAVVDQMLDTLVNRL